MADSGTFHGKRRPLRLLRNPFSSEDHTSKESHRQFPETHQSETIITSPRRTPAGISNSLAQGSSHTPKNSSGYQELPVNARDNHIAEDHCKNNKSKNSMGTPEPSYSAASSTGYHNTTDIKENDNKAMLMKMMATF